MGGFGLVKDAFLELMSKFPQDALVLTKVRQLFTEVRSFDSEAAAKLAADIASVADESNSADAKELSRFMKDIIVLFETGIGNFKAIGNIIVDDAEFMERLTELNEDPTPARR